MHAQGGRGEVAADEGRSRAETPVRPLISGRCPKTVPEPGRALDSVRHLSVGGSPDGAVWRTTSTIRVARVPEPTAGGQYRGFRGASWPRSISCILRQSEPVRIESHPSPR